MRIMAVSITAMIAALTAGCAAVSDGSSQPIRIDTSPVAGANCVLSNSRGQWPVVSPGVATVLKSGSVLKIICTKEGWQETTDYVASGASTKALVGAAIPYWGILESGADAITGAGSTYPTGYTIRLKPPETSAAAISAAASTTASPQ
jgi:hypothetical protein